MFETKGNYILLSIIIHKFVGIECYNNSSHDIIRSEGFILGKFDFFFQI